MKLTWAVITFIWGCLSTRTEGITLTASGAEAEILTKCKGDSLVLNEPSPDKGAHHVFVYRNDETVASTSVSAAGQMKGRLLVHSDTSVMLTNLTSNDLGRYRVEVKLSDETTEEYSVSLVIGEPPQTIDGNLFVSSDSTETSFVSLKCGQFTSLGYPPVSVIWKDPTGQMLASTGFSEQYFTLRLPVNVAKSGNYCCQLDCVGPNYCCLDDMSPLRKCAQIDLLTGREDKQEPREVTPCDLTRLEQRVSEMDVILRELNVTSLLQRVSEVDVLVRELKSEKAGEDCSQSSVAAMAHLVHRQAKCDQLDSFIDRLGSAEKKFENDIEGVDRIVTYMLDQLDSMNQTMTNLQNGVGKDSFLDNHQLTTNTSYQLEDYISRMDVTEKKFQSDMEDALSKLKQVDDQIAKVDERIAKLDGWMSKADEYHNLITRNLTSLSHDVRDLKTEMENSEIKSQAKVFLNRFSNLDKTLNDHRLQCDKETMNINTTLQNGLSRLKLIDDRISKLDDRMSKVDDWRSKASDYQSQMTRNLTNIGQDVVALKTTTDHGVSTTNSKVASVEKDLYAHINRCNPSCWDFNALKGCPEQKGYHLFGKRCLKLYTHKQTFTEAKWRCEADGAHLVHLKSRDIDLPPFLLLMAANGRQESKKHSDAMWIGASDILTEGRFQWSDGTELPTDSDLWDKKEPNNKRNEDCVHALYRPDVVINDEDCSSKNDFVCQRDL